MADCSSTVMFLHGLTGSAENFDHIAVNLSCKCIAVDLPGHGKTNPIPDADRFRPERVIADLLKITQILAEGAVILVGYSMGARLAMQMALFHPSIIVKLVVESGNPGIVDETDRRNRLDQDKLLAQRIKLDYTHFLKIWNRLPLFDSPASAPASPAGNFSKIQLAQNPAGIALSLVMNSTGLMAPMQNQLNNLTMPVHAITGANDHKYCSIWSDIKTHLPNINHNIIADAGHRVHLDNPQLYTNLLQNVIQS
jgi:2-succinyl-6-hydroxy-2,4-cyclohexadiene-1-carboxylate synthase